MALTNLTADGTNTFPTVPGKRYAWMLGISSGSGTVALQWQANTNSRFTYEDGSLTASGGLEFLCVSNPTLVVVSSSTDLVAYTDVIPVVEK